MSFPLPPPSLSTVELRLIVCLGGSKTTVLPGLLLQIELTSGDLDVDVDLDTMFGRVGT